MNENEYKAKLMPFKVLLQQCRDENAGMKASLEIARQGLLSFGRIPYTEVDDLGSCLIWVSKRAREVLQLMDGAEGSGSKAPSPGTGETK